MLLVEPFRTRKHVALLGGGHAIRRPDIQKWIAVVSNDRALISGWEKSRTIYGWAGLGATLEHHHVGRQVLTLTAQAIDDPRTHAREADADGPSVHQVQCHSVHEG